MESTDVSLEDIAMECGTPSSEFDRESGQRVRETGRGLTEVPGCASSYLPNTTISKLFEAQARRVPENVAVISGEDQLSYWQLNRAANLMARRLIQSGVFVGEFIPILMPRCTEMVISQLAILKCGAIYVPIDPELPKERQDFIISDCRASRALALSADSPCAAVQKLYAVDLEECRNPERAIVTDNLDLELPAKTAAYVMYTSGSTGTPKGVVIPHQGVVRLAINNGYAEIEDTDRVAHCSNPSFDAATFEIWGALLNGATLVIVPQPILLNTKRFSELIRANISTLFLTTALFNQYALTSPEIFSHLKYLLFGGEAADPNCVNRVLMRGSPRHLLNVYGPTETTTFASSCCITSISEGTGSLPIGRPISNTQIYVMDDQQQLVTAEASGEIFIGGAGVAVGYLNRPALTAEVFLPDPFTEMPGARLYKTGDRGRWDPNGNLDLHGRRDFQVKIRGFRVELGEVEVALRRSPGVQQAVVIVREDRRARRLVGYVVLNLPSDAKHVVGDASANSRSEHTDRLAKEAYQHTPSSVTQLLVQVKRHLRQTMPHYMVPNSIVAIDRIPLTSNGKVDRSALPSMSGREAKSEYVAPRTSTEEALSELWREVLSVDEVGIDDNFLEVGGNSVLAMNVIAAIDEMFGTEIPTLAIYQHPTIRTMGQFIESVFP